MEMGLVRAEYMDIQTLVTRSMMQFEKFLGFDQLRLIITHMSPNLMTKVKAEK